LEYKALKDGLPAYKHSISNPNISTNDRAIDFFEKNIIVNGNNLEKLRKRYSRYVENSEIIISNVERFEFPGEY